MPEDKPHEDWLAEFRRDVDAALPQPFVAPSAVAQSAHDSFETWWKAEQEPILDSAPRRFSQPALEDSPEPLGSLVAKLEALGEEKARLERNIQKDSGESADLKERHGRLTEAFAELQRKMSRAREAYEAHIAKLESQVKLLDEQSKSLRGDKSFLEGAFMRLEDRNKALENETRLLLERAGAAERAQLDLRRQVSDLQAEIGQIRVEDAAKRGALEEMRKQAGR